MERAVRQPLQLFGLELGLGGHLRARVLVNAQLLLVFVELRPKRRAL